MKKQLRKPENWQDFETLCKRLWGEHWRCPEIKKNGRSGQNQSGVDVYGIPQGEDRYYGIQCKGKDDYTHAKLTEKEILGEIDKAKQFKPTLKKFYFATTANKDVEIEEIIREVDELHRRQGLFEVHVFSWEDIVDLIDENRETHDWYVNGIGFRNQHEAIITFGDGTDRLISTPKFWRTITHYKLGSPSMKLPPELKGMQIFLDMHEQQERLSRLSNIKITPSMLDPLRPRYNQANCGFELVVANIGSAVIDNVEVSFQFEGNLKRAATFSKGIPFHNPPFPYNTFVDKQEPWRGKIIPKNPTLVQKKKVLSDRMFIEAEADVGEVLIKWELIARDYTASGVLTIEIHPEFTEETKVVGVSNPSQVREEVRVTPIVY